MFVQVIEAEEVRRRDGFLSIAKGIESVVPYHSIEKFTSKVDNSHDVSASVKRISMGLPNIIEFK